MHSTDNRDKHQPPNAWKPTRAQVQAAYDQTIPDVLSKGLHVVFVGINPSLYSAAVGHHFARPGNRFWPALHRAGFTDRQLSPFEDQRLIDFGCGLTNVVERATARADEISRDEFLAGAERLTRRLKRIRASHVAFLGIMAYRAAFDRKHAVVGRQLEKLGDAAIWVLPNPSGLNAHYQLPELARLYGRVRRAM